METKLLSIIIPTYNRRQYLEKNIFQLTALIYEKKLSNQVNIIVSNNASTDDTHTLLSKYALSTDVEINVFNQVNNIGLEENSLFVLSKADSKYVMYLGDDDYIAEEYLTQVLDKICNDQNISCIIPSIKPIDYLGSILQGGRDLQMQSSYHSKGFENCLRNSYRGHQLSGLVLLRDGLYESYKKNLVNNIYPFIYFVSLCCLNGKTWHFTDYPVLVTAAEQKDKDWTYQKDGLISEVFDNYCKLPNLSFLEKNRLQIKVLLVQPFRFMMYTTVGVKQFVRAFFEIILSNKTLFLTKLVFPFIVLKSLLRLIAGRLKAKIFSLCR